MTISHSYSAHSDRDGNLLLLYRWDSSHLYSAPAKRRATANSTS
ncbi:hypothetical protein [Nostoc sp. PCC 7524]|nr:hypothetical protein [Nostoc sp. PCC 7524]